jgi:predicted ABC-type exoprotein transport system permease subunit
MNRKNHFLLLVIFLSAFGIVFFSGSKEKIPGELPNIIWLTSIISAQI